MMTHYLVLLKLIEEPASNLYDLELKPQTPELVLAQQYLNGDQTERVCQLEPSPIVLSSPPSVVLGAHSLPSSLVCCPLAPQTLSLHPVVIAPAHQALSAVPAAIAYHRGQSMCPF